jgi:hypothetical protein
MLQAGRSRVPFSISFEFSIGVFLPADQRFFGRQSLYQKLIPGIFLGVKKDRPTSPPSVNRLPKINVRASMYQKPMGLFSLLEG